MFQGPGGCHGDNFGFSPYNWAAKWKNSTSSLCSTTMAENDGWCMKEPQQDPGLSQGISHVAGMGWVPMGKLQPSNNSNNRWFWKTSFCIFSFRPLSKFQHIRRGCSSLQRVGKTSKPTQPTCYPQPTWSCIFPPRTDPWIGLPTKIGDNNCFFFPFSLAIKGAATWIYPVILDDSEVL